MQPKFKVGDKAMKTFENLEKGDEAMKTFENLEKGDEVIDDDGYERTVIERLGEIIFSSRSDDRKAASGYATSHTLKELGWKPKQPTEAPKKLTVAEVSEKLGYELEIIK